MSHGPRLSFLSHDGARFPASNSVLRKRATRQRRWRGATRRRHLASSRFGAVIAGAAVAALSAADDLADDIHNEEKRHEPRRSSSPKVQVLLSDYEFSIRLPLWLFHP